MKLHLLDLCWGWAESKHRQLLFCFPNFHINLSPFLLWFYPWYHQPAQRFISAVTRHGHVCLTEEMETINRLVTEPCAIRWQKQHPSHWMLFYLGIILFVLMEKLQGLGWHSLYGEMLWGCTVQADISSVTPEPRWDHRPTPSSAA